MNQIHLVYWTLKGNGVGSVVGAFSTKEKAEAAAASAEKRDREREPRTEYVVRSFGIDSAI